MAGDEIFPNNCTTNISRKVGKSERFQPRGNMRPRPTEIGFDRYLGRVHKMMQVWIMESGDSNFTRISDQDNAYHQACLQGELRLYGRARWRQIAQDLNIPYEDVAYQLRS